MELGGANLTDAEREALLEVMQRAKNFDEKTQQSLNSRLEGQLYKWTNALKGWQPRWLCVDQQQGVLHYYTSEDRKKAPPRGSLHLWGAVIAPSDEDSQTFTVNGANGEVYKLRGADARERQYWVSRLRNEIERCTNSTHSGYPKVQVHTPQAQPQPHTSTITPSPLSPTTTSDKAESHTPLTTPTRKYSKSKRSLAKLASRASLKKKAKHRKVGPSVDQEDGGGLPGGETMLALLTSLQGVQNTLTGQLEACSGTGVEPLDQNVLLLKATSQAALHSVKDCLALIRLQQQVPSSTDGPSNQISVGDEGVSGSQPQTNGASPSRTLTTL